MITHNAHPVNQSAWGSRLLSRADRWLRRIFAVRGIPQDDGGRTPLSSFLLPLPLLFLYGGIMGSWGMWGADSISANQWMQVLYSAIKVPLLLSLMFFLSIPFLFVLYALAGLAQDFRRVITLLAETQSAFAAALLGFAPFTLLWYGSSANYVHAILFNGLLFGLAAAVRHVVFRRRVGEMELRHHRHRLLLRLWFLLSAFVGVQAGWILRPFVGTPGMVPEFIREDSWGNAYVEVAMMIVNAL